MSSRDSDSDCSQSLLKEYPTALESQWNNYFQNQVGTDEAENEIKSNQSRFELPQSSDCCKDFKSTLKRIEDKMDLILSRIGANFSNQNESNSTHIEESSSRTTPTQTLIPPLGNESIEGSVICDTQSPRGRGSLTVEIGPSNQLCLGAGRQDFRPAAASAALGKENTWILRKLTRPRVPLNKEADKTIIISDISSDEEDPTPPPTQVLPVQIIPEQNKSNLKRKISFGLNPGQVQTVTLDDMVNKTSVNVNAPQPFVSVNAPQPFVSVNAPQHIPILPKNKIIRKKLGRPPKMMDCPDPGCQMKLKGQCELRRHSAFHLKTVERPFPCPLCPNMNFTTKNGRSNHFWHYHTGKKNAENQSSVDAANANKEVLNAAHPNRDAAITSQPIQLHFRGI